MIDYLTRIFLLIIAGCSAFFIVVFTLFLMNAVFYIMKEYVKDLIRYASGKHKDHGEKDASTD